MHDKTIDELSKIAQNHNTSFQYRNRWKAGDRTKKQYRLIMKTMKDPQATEFLLKWERKTGKRFPEIWAYQLINDSTKFLKEYECNSIQYESDLENLKIIRKRNPSFRYLDMWKDGDRSKEQYRLITKYMMNPKTAEFLLKWERKTGKRFPEIWANELINDPIKFLEEHKI